MKKLFTLCAALIMGASAFTAMAEDITIEFTNCTFNNYLSYGYWYYLGTSTDSLYTLSLSPNNVTTIDGTLSQSEMFETYIMDYSQGEIGTKIYLTNGTYVVEETEDGILLNAEADGQVKQGYDKVDNGNHYILRCTTGTTLPAVTAIELVSTEAKKAAKVMIDGRLQIVTGNASYDVNGAKAKL